jgi:hypothetical protein
MRRKLSCVFGLSVSMFCAGLASTALAQATPAPLSPHAARIATLREAHALLVHANHDYDGHRAKAAEAVHKALKELGYEHKKAPAGATPAAQTKVHEPQAASDAQMKQALQLLGGVQFNGKHPKAAAHVEHAVREIKTALSIK